MPHPFVEFPTLEDFIAKALDNKCQRVIFPGTLSGPEGEVIPRCLMGPRGITVVLPDIEYDERLTPTVLRGLCRQLGISPDLYGVGLL